MPEARRGSKRAKRQGPKVQTALLPQPHTLNTGLKRPASWLKLKQGSAIAWPFCSD